MQSVENIEKAPICLEKQGKKTSDLENHWNGYLVNRRALLIGAGLTSLLAIASSFAMNAYRHHQNGQIRNINCLFGQDIDGVIRDFNYYSKAVENRGLATDQYCLAELIKSGNGTQLSLEKARNLYKSAIEQGLTLAKTPLCQPAMFEQKFSHGYLYSEFRSICCLEEASFHKNHACPWYKDSNSTS